MEKRFLPAVIVGFTGYFAMMAGGIWLLALLAVVVFFVTKEYTKILLNKGFFPSPKVIFVSSMVILLVAHFNRADLLPFVLTACAFVAFMGVLFKGKQPYIANVATNLLGIIYCGLFPSYILFLRQLGPVGDSVVPYPTGAGYCFILLISVLLCDSFCYFVGSRFGKHKLSKVISPNKTVEGAVGGTLVSVLCMIPICMLLGMNWYHALPLVFLVTIFAQIGDLCESMIKRDAGVKDSGDMIPGHGGFLDRCDSYILAIPVMYYFCNFFIHNTQWLDSIALFFKGLF